MFTDYQSDRIWDHLGISLQELLGGMILVRITEFRRPAIKVGPILWTRVLNWAKERTLSGHKQSWLSPSRKQIWHELLLQALAVLASQLWLPVRLNKLLLFKLLSSGFWCHSNRKNRNYDGRVEVIRNLGSGLHPMSRENTHTSLASHKAQGNILSLNGDPGEVGKAGRGERIFPCCVRRQNKDNQALGEMTDSDIMTTFLMIYAVSRKGWFIRHQDLFLLILKLKVKSVSWMEFKSPLGQPSLLTAGALYFPGPCR